MLGGVLSIALGYAVAQAPSGAPAGATGMCKDGTYSTSASKSGACRGHNGVQTWYATTQATAAPAASSAAATGAKPATAPTATSGANATASTPASSKKLSPAQAAAAKPTAPGGGKGLVWVNTSSNVYHCSDDPFYGKTKAGSVYERGRREGERRTRRPRPELCREIEIESRDHPEAAG